MMRLGFGRRPAKKKIGRVVLRSGSKSPAPVEGPALFEAAPVLQIDPAVIAAPAPVKVKDFRARSQKKDGPKAFHNARGGFADKQRIRAIIPADLRGTVYVPYFGAGDIAEKTYREGFHLFGCDLDPAAVKTAAARMDESRIPAHIIVGNAI